MERRPVRRAQAVFVGAFTVAGVAAGLGLIAIAQGQVLRPARAAVAKAALPAGSPHAIGATPVILMGLQMVTPLVGWGVGERADRQDQQLLRTTDGGVHWTDVTPAAGRNARSVPFFLGSDRAFLLVNGEQRRNTVYRSSDGGVTWQAGLPFTVRAEFGAYGPMGRLPLQFVDPLHGFMAFGFGQGEGIGVYATDDGGQHWALRSLTVARPGLSTAGSLPTGCTKTGVTFSSASVGWATAHCPGGRPFLYESRNGGRTWQSQSLPAPLDYPADLETNCTCGSIPPDFTSSRDGVLTFAAPDFVYSTHDGGGSWTPMPLPSQVLGNAPMFLDGSTGWIITLRVDQTTRLSSFDRLFVTHDGGVSWQPLESDREVQSLAFVDRQTGWAINLPRDGSPPQLFQTRDGGTTWQQLFPVVDQVTQAERI